MTKIREIETADVRFPTGGTGRIRASMWSATLLRVRVDVLGERGRMTVTNFAAPQLPHRFSVTVDGCGRRERFRGPSTYVHQLRAFAAAVRGEPTNLTPPADSVATMALIDAIYSHAGMPLRGSDRDGDRG